MKNAMLLLQYEKKSAFYFARLIAVRETRKVTPQARPLGRRLQEIVRVILFET